MNKLLSISANNSKYDRQCEALYARNFGPGRFAKAAERLREGNVCCDKVSKLAMADDTVIGACRLWPIVADNGVNALFLGPIAVDGAHRQAGLGQRLVEACLKSVDKELAQVVILVGDLGYFSKMGFQMAPLGLLEMPGPVDPKRLLWRLRGQHLLPEGRLTVPRATSQLG